MTTKVITPAIWLIVLIFGLPMLSETIYSPSQPEIARDLASSDSLVEFTLTIYLFGFSFGTLFFGNISDRFGRKPCLIAGLSVFIMGCIGCYFSSQIWMLIVSRFVQAFGGSTGAVLGQALCRDSFRGKALSKVYSTAASAMAIFPALAPVIGGFIAEKFEWENIFLFLILFALILLFFIFKQLPETHPKERQRKNAIFPVFLRLVRDKHVICLACIVGGSKGIMFSYFAEGSFILIDNLELSPLQYGYSYLLLSGSTMLGGICSRFLHQKFSSLQILTMGIYCIVISGLIFSTLSTWYIFGDSISKQMMIAVTIGSQMLCFFGICIASSNALALSLTRYSDCIGTASSLCGFFYYILISLVTLGMAFLHNDTLIPMPYYFLCIGLFMLTIKKLLHLHKI